MTELSPRLQEVLDQIDAEDVATRYRYHAELMNAICESRALGIAVPAQINDLAEDLLSELIEARFDNMPV